MPLQNEALSFLSSNKQLQVKKFKWSPKDNQDWRSAKNTIELIDEIGRVGFLTKNAHTTLHPRKYSFLVLYKSERIFALDIDESGQHLNQDRTPVRGNHWHDQYPIRDVSCETRRGLPHREWLEIFCTRANISLAGLRYYAPPYLNAQMDLL